MRVVDLSITYCLALFCLATMEVHGFSPVAVAPIRRYAGVGSEALIRAIPQGQWWPSPGTSSRLSSGSNHQAEASTFSPQQPWWTGLVVASVVSSAVWGLPLSPSDGVANALELSPGTTTLETTLSRKEIIDRSTTTVARLVQTLLKDRDPLLQSVQKIQSVVGQELSSDTWKEIRTIVVEFKQELSSSTTINPPTDWKRTLQDLKDGKINVIVNGEIINVSLERVEDPKKMNGDGTATTTTTDGEAPVNDLRFVLPDDEWVLRVRGYKGVDPTAVATQVVIPKKTYSSSLPFIGFLDDWDSPYPSEYLPEGVSKTYGDIWVFQGVLAISFIYAWSYAYYGGSIEQQENDAKAKKEAAAKARNKKVDVTQQQLTTIKEKPKKVVVDKPKKTALNEAANGNKETAAPGSGTAWVGIVEAPEEVPDKDADVNVVIGFDEEGKVVITASETKKSREGIVSFILALYFPWLGMVVPGMTMKTGPPSTPRVEEAKEQSKWGCFSLVRALYFPWVGILQGK
jgi:hypothetical protein